MKRKQLGLALSGIISTFFLPCLHLEAEVPEQLWAPRERGGPAWQASTSGGNALETYRALSPTDSAKLARFLEYSPPGQRPDGTEAELSSCSPLETIKGHAAARSFDEAWSQSAVVLLATIQSRAQGIYFGQPGSMLEVAVEEALKAGWDRTELYVFVPYIRQRIEGKLLCVGTQEPKIQGRLILFADHEDDFKDLSGELIAAPPMANLAFEDTAGGLAGKAPLFTEGLSSIDDALVALRRKARDEG